MSVALGHHATSNPGAVMRRPIIIDDNEGARPTVEPLRLLDYGCSTIALSTMAPRARTWRLRSRLETDARSIARSGMADAEQSGW